MRVRGKTMIDVGNNCIHCGRDTSFGSGLFVNRIPADDGEKDGYACPECMAMPCCRCDELIPMDEDITSDQCGYDQYFQDGAWRVHEECLTAEEKRLRE